MSERSSKTLSKNRTNLANATNVTMAVEHSVAILCLLNSVSACDRSNPCPLLEGATRTLSIHTPIFYTLLI